MHKTNRLLQGIGEQVSSVRYPRNMVYTECIKKE